MDWRDPSSLVGNGPMVLLELGEDGAVLGHNPHWGASAGNVGQVRIPFRADKDVDVAEWRAGKHDILLAPVREAADLPRTLAGQAPQLSTAFLGVAADREALQDLRVRLAIAHAVDREALLAATSGIDAPAGRGGLIPPAMPGHGATAAPPYDPDARARAAGGGRASGRRGAAELRVAAHPWRPGDALVEQLAAVGIPAAVHVPANKWGHEHGCDLWMSSWHADYPDPDGFFLGLLRIEPFWRDEETDALLRGRAGLAAPRRAQRLLREFERVWIGQRVGARPPVLRAALVLRRPSVHGLHIGPMRIAHLEQVVVDRRLRAGRRASAGGAHLLGEGRQHRPGDLGVRLQEGLEDPRGHAQADEVGVRHDGGRARPVVEQRDLAERVARPELAPLLPADLDGRGALRDDEEAEALLTLGDDVIAP